MPLTHYIRLVARSLLLLLLCSSILCSDNPLDDCHSVKACGDFTFDYPFGEKSRGCSDSQFQFECDGGYPLLYINDEKYEILYPPVLDNNSKNLTLINGTLFGSKCNLTHNTQLFPDDSNSFVIVNEYKQTFWGDCDPSFQSIYAKGVQAIWLCEANWYYSLDPNINSSGTRFCKTQRRLPMLEITWHVDKKKDQSCAACLRSKGRCGFDDFDQFLCRCQDNASYPDQCPNNGGRNKSATVIGCSVGGAALIAIAVGLSLTFYRKRRKTRSRGLASEDMEAAVLPRRQISNLPTFSYEELRQATNCFDEENEVGDGGFGSVYLGKLRDGRTVAVKRLYQDNSRRLEQFINEVQIFSTLNHPRVVRLYGCSSADSPELLLVYEFVSNGTLADHLHGDRRKPRGLPWNIRLNIAIQTAEALAFLHSVDPPIFHRDVKSSNILLDENFNVKVADFGLCRLVPVNASHVTTAPQGTPGYVDPEYHQCFQLTEKSDVYSFGVVLVEIISAKLAVDINRNRMEINLANMAKSKIQEGALHELVDPQMEIEMNHEVKVTVSAVAELAFRCLASERDDRPHMKEVVSQLEEIRKSWDTSTGPVEQQWGSFSDIKEPLSPISVQDKWSSISSTPNTSA